tara:strand:- start:2187 stop:3317 length:1131 start_codon:yes stop_codon:yes gene_type:complete
MSLKNPFQAPGVVTQNIAGPLAPGQDPSSMTRQIAGNSPFANKLATMGGLNNALSQDDMMKMSNKDLDAYNKKFKTAKGAGMSDLLMALGSAFKGEDITGNVEKMRDARTSRADEARKIQLQNEMARLYRQGDMEGAMAIGMELGDSGITQGIIQQYNKELNRPKRSADGRYLITYDADGTPQYTLDEDLQNQELDFLRQKEEIENVNKNKPGASFLNAERKEVELIDDLERVASEADYFAQQMEAGNLDLSITDNIADGVKNYITGNLFTSPEGQKEFEVNQKYNRFIEQLRATSLALQTGTKTDMDAELAMKQVESSRNPEEFIIAMNELKKINRQRADLKRGILIDQRSELGYRIPDYLKQSFADDIEFEEVE